MQHRIREAHQHITHPSHIFGNLILTGNSFFDQYLLTCIHTLMFGTILYFVASSLSYFIFFKQYHKKFTPLHPQLQEYQEQILFDIKWSLINIVGQTPLVSLIKCLYPYYSKIQYSWNLTYLLPLYIVFHILYDEFFTYWVHRFLHHPILYSTLHNIHHKSKSVTPFSGFAFHPLDAFAQAVPVFTSCFFVPLPIDFVLLHGLITSLWAISIHDNVNLIPFKGILYAGSHSIHHFPWGENYNYGKITSICDRLYGSYCDPSGITGYGYQQSPVFKEFFDSINSIFEKMVPDNGKWKVEKQSRNQYQLKIKQMLGDKTL